MLLLLLLLLPSRAVLGETEVASSSHEFAERDAQAPLRRGKGCFVPSSEVTLADGSRRQLKDITVGQQVQSWDELHDLPAISIVQADPVFERLHHELVEIMLANATIIATDDHPI